MINNLPASWASPRLGDICEINPRSKQDLGLDQSVSFVPMNAVDEQSGTIVNAPVRPYREVMKGYTPFIEGDVLFAKITPCMENGKAAIATGLANGVGFGSTEFHVLRPGPLVLAEWVFFFLRVDAVRRQAAASFQGAVGQQRVPESFLAGFRLPLPPLSEQRRIVDVAREMERIRSLRSLATVRAAEVLPALFSSMFGDLTAKKARWPVRKISDVVAEFVGGKSLPDSGSDVPGGLRVLKISAVTSGRFDPKESKPAPPGHTPAQHHFVNRNDLLISRANTAELVGATALVEDCPSNLLLPDKLWRFVWQYPENTSPEFMSVLFRMPSVRRMISSAATGTGGSMKNISMQKLMSLRLSIPPSRLQLAFGKIYREMRTVNNLSWNGTISSALHNSLLSRAFSGNLTAHWREQYAHRLEEEVERRNQALDAAGASVRFHGAEPSNLTAHVRSEQGARTGLTRDQRMVLEGIPASNEQELEDKAERRDVGEAFTAAQIASALTGPLHNNTHAVEANLAVLAARGLVIALSREQRAPHTDETIYGNCYRLATADPDGDRVEDGLPPVGGGELRDQEIRRVLGQPPAAESEP